MTPAQVEALLENRRKAKERIAREVFGPRCSCHPEDPCDCGARGPSAQLTIETGREPPATRSVVLPLPPSVNRRFQARAVPTKKMRRGKAGLERVWVAQGYLDESVKEYYQLVDAQCRREKWPAPFPAEVMLRATGVVTMARAGCDLDDRLKCLFDSLNGRVYEDDEQVAELHMVRRVDSARPGVVVTFEPLTVDRYGRER